MRARAAYIRSLGTTSILVAAAFLMLGVVGALVGFHGWPEGAVGETVRSVPLTPTPQPVLSAVRTVRKAPAARVASRTGARRGTTGLTKVPVSSPRPVGYPIALTPGHAVPTSGTSPAPTQHDPSPTDAIAPPADPGQVETLVDQVVGSVPPPPGDSSQVTVPIVGVTVSVPSVPSP